MDTCFNYCSDSAYFSSDERRWISKIRKLASAHPDQVTILKQPEDNDGCIYARLPVRAMKISISSRKGTPMSEEHKTKLIEGRKKFLAKKNG